jgi:hypothetical protein
VSLEKREREREEKVRERKSNESAIECLSSNRKCG